MWNLRYADDTTLISRSRELIPQATKLENVNFGLQINVAMKHFMLLNDNHPINIGGKQIN